MSDTRFNVGLNLNFKRFWHLFLFYNEVVLGEHIDHLWALFVDLGWDGGSDHRSRFFDAAKGQVLQETLVFVWTVAWHYYWGWVRGESFLIVHELGVAGKTLRNERNLFTLVICESLREFTQFICVHTVRGTTTVALLVYLWARYWVLWKYWRFGRKCVSHFSSGVILIRLFRNII